MGERHDLRLEPPGWDSPGFDETVPRRPGPGGGWRACGTARATAGSSPPTPACRSASRRRSPRSAVTRTADGTHRRRLRAEPDRVAAHQGQRAGGHVRPGQARRGARRRRPPVHRQPAHRAAGRRVRAGGRARGPRAAVHGARLPVRRGDRLPGRAGPGRHRGPRRALGHPRRRGVRVAASRGSTSSSATSTGASGATSSAYPPTARSATSASAGSATRRSSPAPPATTATSPPSSPSGWTTWPTRSSRRAPSPTSPPG